MAKSKTKTPIAFLMIQMRFEQPIMALNENDDGNFYFARDVNAPIVTEKQILDFIGADDPATFEIDQIRFEIPTGGKATVQHVVNRPRIIHAEVLPAGCKLSFRATVYAHEAIDAINYAISKGRLAPFETKEFGRYKVDVTTLDNPEIKASNLINRLADAVRKEDK